MKNNGIFNNLLDEMIEELNCHWLDVMDDHQDEFIQRVANFFGVEDAENEVEGFLEWLADTMGDI